MPDQCLDAVYGRDSSYGNSADGGPRQADRLAVAEVEHDVFGREIDVQADNAVPPERRQTSRPHPAEQSLIGNDHIGKTCACPASVLLHTDPERQLSIDPLPRPRDNPCPHLVEPRRRHAASELDRQGPSVAVRLGTITRECLLENDRGPLLRPHNSTPSLLI